jgi:D-alanyl-D-alanine carboxypeptidase-like protein
MLRPTLRPGSAGDALTTIVGSEGGTRHMARAHGFEGTARRRGTVAAVAPAALALALVGAACRHVPPVSDPVASANGRLPDNALTTITPQCRIRSEFADQLAALIATAKAQGVGLTPEQSSFLPAGVPGPPVIESCYRSYAGQVWWRNYYCSTGHCELAAPPGTSKHGLGRAVDFQDQNGELTFTSPGYLWLTKHAATFGFSQPAAMQQGGASEEAWHWEVH